MKKSMVAPLLLKEELPNLSEDFHDDGLWSFEESQIQVSSI